MNVPRVVAWELTRACPLACTHCRAQSVSARNPEELSTDEIRKVIDSITSFAKPIIILTGGEPLLRDDVLDIARHASDAGLRVALATCGSLLDETKARELLDAGVMRISISLDGATGASHDEFRGVEGSFNAAVDASASCVATGLAFQVNTTVWSGNVDELPEILALAEKLGAAAFHVFVMVPTGRARLMADYVLTRDRYESVLKWLAEKAAEKKIEIKPTCAPQYGPVTGDMGQYARGGCLGGRSFAFISHIGVIQPCGFLDLNCGELRASGLDFKGVWENSAIFNELRNQREYSGLCASCKYWKSCGGCRARVFEADGDYLATDPMCPFVDE